MRFLLFILVTSLLFVSCGETELKRRTTGYKGEAKLNPFLAAERFLDKQGYEASSERGLEKMDYGTSTFFIPVSSINTVSRAKRLLNWVDDGGHLVVMMEGGEMGGYDFVITPVTYTRFFDEGLEGGGEHLFTSLDIEFDAVADFDSSSYTEPTQDEWEEMEEKDRVFLGAHTSEIDLGDGEMTLHHWSGKAFRGDLLYDVEFVSKDDALKEDQHYYFSRLYGSGRVSMLSDARPLRNRYLAHGDNAQFLANLVDLSRSGDVVFYAGDGDGFLSLLWRHFKLAVIGLFVVILLWLWRHLPRFGPAEDIAGGNTREFSDQVRGIGRFLWRHKRDDVMLGTLRNRIQRKLSLQPGAGHEGIFDQLSEKTNLPLDSVIEAMTREHITEPSIMIRVTNNLQTILKHIH